MATLTGQSVASSYEQILHVDRDGGGNTTTFVAVKDGDNGTTFDIELATENLKIPTGNLIIGTAGKGIDFSATTDGGVTTPSELLDDYEEGTWTPTAGDGSNNFAMTAQVGEYVKVGRTVTLSCHISWSGIGSVGTGSLRVGGLPYPVSDLSSSRYGAALGNIKEINTNGGQLVLSGDAGASVLTFYTIHDNATFQTVASNSNDNVSGFIQFTIAYPTT